MLNNGYRFAAGKEPRAWYIAGVLPVVEGVRELDNGSCANLHTGYATRPTLPVENISPIEGVYTWEINNVRNGGLLAYEYEWEEASTKSVEASGLNIGNRN